VDVRRLETRLDGPILVELVKHGDERGFFAETYREDEFAQMGIPVKWVQDNHSRSAGKIVRGMHFQLGAGVAKLVRCGRGAIYDVVVDLRRGSPTWGQAEGFELTEENMRVVYCPVGFAHGFCTLSEVATTIYKQSVYFATGPESELSYQDPAIGIDWPIPVEELQASEKDEAAPTLSELEPKLEGPQFEYSG
jgi:dTDP-4-dehydrorhamnose 3,5-epimerase